MRQQIQKFGRALSGMVMPNIGAFIAWGFVTALFIPSGWWPNTQMARLVDPMLTYLLPLLIAYTAGRNVAGERGGVIGAIAAMGVIVGSDIPMFIGAMVMGPLGGYTIRWFDKLTQGRIKAGFEMLVSNFSIGILGMLLAILGYWVIGGAVTGLTLLVSNGVEVVIRHGLLPLVSLLVEPSKVLFLNNALNHGIFSPIGIEQARETGQSIMFLLETNPGPGLGVLLACWFFGRGNMRQSAPGAVIIQFCGGIHEIYFPYILARPALILAPVAGSAAGLLFFSLAGAGLVAPASPGSIISVLAMAPKGQTLVVLAGVLISTAVSLLMAAPFVRRAATAEDMPTGAIPATQGGAPAVKAAQYFPAHIRKVVFACDAGMGSSALGATRFRKRLSDAGIGMVVGNCAADGIPADADVVVCQSVLAGRIAGAIAAGIAARRDAGVTEPLNVIACENGVRATTQLREAVLKHLDEAQRDWCEQYVGFPDCSVDRIVPPVKSENPIDVVVERFFEWNVERAAFKGAVPEIPGMNPADNLIAYIERKLFTLNTGHAITAYLGRMKGYMTICQSISDEHIHTIVKAAMRESGRGLVALYGFDRDAHFAYIDKIIGRFRNPYLCDDVTRVGREPLRKLSAGDRLVRPILTARRYGIGTPDLLLGVGAALHYDNPEDVQSVEMRRLVEKEGVKAALARIASLPDTDPLLPLAAQAYDEVERIIAKIPEAQ